MRPRLAAAVLAVIATSILAIADATTIHDRERLWLLAAYFAIPALAVAIATPFLRLRTLLILLFASTLPALVRFLLGAHTAGAAFDRLSLNPVWFLVVWLPAALAVIAVLGPRTGAGERMTAFGLRLWRPAAAFLLMFVALTFVSKQALSEDLSYAETVVAAELLLVGVGLLIADLLPPRAQKPALEWTWFTMAGLSLFVVYLAVDHVDTLNKDRHRIRSDIRSARLVRSEIAEIAGRYESAGRLSPAARRQIASELASLDAEEREHQLALARSPSPASAAVTLAVPAVVMFGLYLLLFVSTWRMRRGATSEAAVAPSS